MANWPDYSLRYARVWGRIVTLSNGQVALVLLADASADQAVTNAHQLREQQRAANEVLRQQRIAEQHQLRQHQRQQIRAKLRRIGEGVIGWGHALFSIGIFTPLIGSLAGVVHSGIVDLYITLAGLIIGSLLICAVLGLIFPYPRDQEVVSSPAVAGFVAGLPITLYLGITGSTSTAIWGWPFAFGMLVHAGFGIVRRTEK